MYTFVWNLVLAVRALNPCELSSYVIEGTCIDTGSSSLICAVVKSPNAQNTLEHVVAVLSESVPVASLFLAKPGSHN